MRKLNNEALAVHHACKINIIEAIDPVDNGSSIIDTGVWRVSLESLDSFETLETFESLDTIENIETIETIEKTSPHFSIDDRSGIIYGIDSLNYIYFTSMMCSQSFIAQLPF